MRLPVSLAPNDCVVRTGGSLHARFSPLVSSPLPPVAPAGARLKCAIDDSDSGLYAILYMRAMTYTAAREKLASTMDSVCDEHDPVVITRNRDQAVVLISLEDYEALEETAYLLRVPANARRLLTSIANVKKGKGVIKALKELPE